MVRPCPRAIAHPARCPTIRARARQSFRCKSSRSASTIDATSKTCVSPARPVTKRRRPATIAPTRCCPRAPAAMRVTAAIIEICWQVRADPADAMGQCAYCHLGYSRSAGNRVAPLSVPKPNLRFDHALPRHAQHRLRAVPRRGRKPGACDARPAAADAWLSQLPPSTGARCGPRSRGVPHLSPHRSERHDQGQLCLGFALTPELAARCGSRSGLDRTAQSRGRQRHAASAPTATPRNRAPIATTVESGRVGSTPMIGSACTRWRPGKTNRSARAATAISRFA